MIEILPREAVILASDFPALVAWYRDVLGFTVVKLFEEGYHYCNLETPAGIKIGIAAAEEMDVVPGARSRNTVILQFEVDNVQDFFTYLEQRGGSVAFGPSFNKKDAFWFGSFLDPEGNPYWVVDKNCP